MFIDKELIKNIDGKTLYEKIKYLTEKFDANLAWTILNKIHNYMYGKADYIRNPTLENERKIIMTNIKKKTKRTNKRDDEICLENVKNDMAGSFYMNRFPINELKSEEEVQECEPFTPAQKEYINKMINDAIKGLSLKADRYFDSTCIDISLCNNGDVISSTDFWIK